MKKWLSTIFCLVLGWTSTAHADVAFSTFGPSNGFDALSGSIIEGPSSEFPQIIAEKFSPTNSILLDGVELALTADIGIPSLGVSIYSDLGGVPGTELEFVGLPSFADGIVSAPFTGNVQLDSGSNYWLAVSTGDSSIQLWNDTAPSLFGTQAVSEDGGASWFAYNTDPFSRAAFRVNGTLLGPADPPDLPLINPGTGWRFFRGLAEPSTGIDWTTQAFDDTTWDFGNSGFGYDTDVATQAGLLSHVGMELMDMRDDGVNQDAYTSLYLRRNFSVVNPFEINELIFELDYDDSFIAYVNGVEIARSVFGTEGTPEPFDGLGTDHESTNGDANLPLERYVIDLATDFPDLLQAGSANVLAIHGLNTALDDDDFVLSQISLGGNVLLSAGADFNGDGSVDGDDLTLWEPAYGQNADADADLDGDSDGADFLAWQQQYTGPAQVVAVAVPEPASLWLCVAVFPLVLRNRQH